MPELLAPAGDPDSGYAALNYGADAVYLGCKHLSARAEAVNFSTRDLAEFASYAHTLSPSRHVYLTLNTLIQQDEIPTAISTLIKAAECGVDAIIVQDWGVARLMKKHFPNLPLHASTQMAIHNVDGALAAKRLGCKRVTLARELTLDEITSLVARVGPELEVETFIHGTLCYSYSGLCLFSSLATGRSGNRGRCAYSCRETADTPLGRAHPFSLKDLALRERVLDLARTGVASLKIEGRKKSPLYVAATVDYYRKILDGQLNGKEAAEAEARLQTIFARPWTKLFLDSPHNPDAADPLVVGHRGSPIGHIARLVRTPAGPGIAFQPSLPIERHDGLQVDVPGETRPYGFPVNHLYTLSGKNARQEEAFAVPAGKTAATSLPPEAPPLAPGMPLYQSSSQAVKRSYPFSRPKPGTFLPKMPVRVEVEIGAAVKNADGTAEAQIACRAILDAPPRWRAITCPETAHPLVAKVEEKAEVFPARDADGAEKAARAAFSRMGDTRFAPGGWSFANPENGFVRQGDWNRLRRNALEKLALLYKERLAMIADRLTKPFAAPAPAASAPATDGGGAPRFLWSVYAETPSILDEFEKEDFAAAAEVVVEITPENAALLDSLAERAGKEKLRLALPLIVRQNAAEKLAHQVDTLWRAGWRSWQIAGLAGWNLLADRPGADLAADWPLYCLNSLAAEQFAAMGCTSLTLSPEDDRDNWARLVPLLGDKARVIAYSHLPLFISAACAHAHLGACRAGDRPRRCNNRREGMRIHMERSGEAEIIASLCGSVVVAPQPYSLSEKLPLLPSLGVRHLRVDFRWKRPAPGAAVSIWRTMLAGKQVKGTCGNFTRGLA